MRSKLEKFKKENSYFDKYDHLEFARPGLLIRLFNESSAERKSDKPLYVEDGKGGFETQDKVKDVVHPYALVIKVGGPEGQKPNYLPGDLVHVAAEDVTGNVLTKEYLEYARNSEIKGAKPIAPRGMRETMPKVEVSWSGFRVRNSFIDNDDTLTFFVPETRVLGKVNI